MRYWVPQMSARELCSEMVSAHLAVVKQHALHSKTFVADHAGMVGLAIMRGLESLGLNLVSA